MNPAPVLVGARLRTYNITQEQFEALWNDAEGRCPLCGKLFGITQNRRAVIDHDHESGHIRGLLCGACNYALGSRPEDWFLHANEYLRHTPAEKLGIHALHREYVDRGL